MLVRDSAREEMEKIRAVIAEALSNIGWQASTGQFTINVVISSADNTPEYREIGLRDSIRKALATQESGLRPREVIRQLETGGFQTASGKTPLSRRVHNELWRMSREEADVCRTERGVYTLK